MKYLISISILVSLLMHHSYSLAQQLGACDAVTSATAATVLGSEFSRRSTQGKRQDLGGGIVMSECIFWTQKNRSRLHVKLVEYQSAKAVDKAFADAAANSGFAKFTKATGIGDKANWWAIDAEAFGINVQKGRFVLILDTRWLDSNTDPGLKELIRLVALEVVKRM